MSVATQYSGLCDRRIKKDASKGCGRSKQVNSKQRQ
jgi:hypothetical protein